MNIAVIFAGGTGTRMNSKDKPKQFLKMHDKPIIIHTLEKFQNNENIDAIVIACIKQWINHLLQLIEYYHISKVKRIVPGGETGQLSIYAGLNAAKDIAEGKNAIVLIHDGVRPLINDDVINKNIASVMKNGSAITSVNVTETIMEINDDASIKYIPDRTHSRLARAPQSFLLDEILDVHNKALLEGKKDFIDSCTMMSHYGKKLYLIDGPIENIKVTTGFLYNEGNFGCSGKLSNIWIGVIICYTKI